MSRLFLKIYSAVLLALTIAIVAGGVFGARRAGVRMRDHEGRLLLAMARSLDDRLDAEPAERHEAILRRASERAEVPPERVPLTDPRLPAEVRAELERGEPATLESEGRTLVAVPLGDLAVLFGPPRDRPAIRPPPAQLFVLALVLLSCGVAVWLVVSPAERRLRELAGLARAFGDGDLRKRAQRSTNDEIGQLASAFNQMADNVERTLESRRELLNTVAHELRTPLARLLFQLEELQETSAEPAAAHLAERAMLSVQQIDRLVDELLDFGRLDAQAPSLAILDLRALVRECAVEAALPADQPAAGPAVLVNADARLLKRLLGNLLSNALRHRRERIALTVDLAGGEARVRVDDDGPGVPEADRARVFEPFVKLTTHDAKPGSAGLGLSIARKIAEAHSGQLAVTSSPLGGACFELRLPLASQTGT